MFHRTSTSDSPLARAALVGVLVLSSAGPARANQTPYVVHGPVITGVSATEAWVAWYTAHHQGLSDGVNQCYLDNLVYGTPNDTIPTLTLSPSASGSSTFEDPTCSRFHNVHITGLAPATHYTFGLDMTSADSAPVSGGLTSAPASGAPFHFIVYGDNRDEPITSTSTRPDHQALVDAILTHDPGAAFLISNGDLALNLPAVSGDDNGYTEYFDVERPLLSTHPIFAALGNHETIDTTFYDGLMSGPTFAGAPHPYYFSLNWGQVHIAFLDAFEGATTLVEGRDPLITDAQIAWLESDLQAAQAAGQQLFIMSHQGAYSHSNDSSAHGGSPDVQTKVIPLMVQYGVQAIFAGHDHYYQRGHEGCIDYLVVGAGGAPMYDPDPTAPGVIVTSKKTSYLVVSVTADGASGEAKDTSGEVFDSFAFVPALPCGGADGGSADGGTDGGGDDPGLSDDAGPRAGDGDPSESISPSDTAGQASRGGCGCRARAGSGEGVSAVGFVVLVLELRKRGRSLRRTQPRSCRQRPGGR